MTKSKATILLCILLVVVLFLGVFTFLPKVKMGSYTYTSPIDYINSGNDLSQGIATTFNIERPDEITDEEFQALVDNSVGVLQNRLSSYGVVGSQIIASDSAINLILPINNYDDDFYSTLYSNGNFEVCTYDDETKVYTTIIDSSQFTESYATYSSSTYYYYVVMKLNPEAQEALMALTADAYETSVKIYFRLDGEDYTNTTLTEQYTDDELYISTTDADKAQSLLTVLQSGKYGFELTQGDVCPVSSKSGEDASLWAYIALAVIVAAVLIAFIVNYGLTGLASGISLIAALTLTVLSCAFIFIGDLTAGAYTAFFLIVALYALSSVFVLEKFKKSANTDDEINLEKRLRASLSKSYAVYTKPFILVGLMTLVASITVWAAASASVRAFGVILTYGTIFGFLAAVYLTKLLANIFYALNHSAKCHRVRKEVKEND